MLDHFSEDSFAVLDKNESFIDRCETALSAYIIRIDRSGLTEDGKFLISEILNSISNLERIGDYCMSIAYDARHVDENHLSFSDLGEKELHLITQATGESLALLSAAFRHSDRKKAICIEPLAETIDESEVDW